jgi:trans-2-enoyl-CoA reductase
MPAKKATKRKKVVTKTAKVENKEVLVEEAVETAPEPEIERPSWADAMKKPRDWQDWAERQLDKNKLDR